MMIFSHDRNMKKVFSILGLNLLCILLLAGCTQHTTPAPRAYTNDFYGFSFDPPGEWKQIDTDDNAIAVRFSPENISEVSLIVALPFTLSEGRALSTFADQTEENLLESGVEYSIVYRDWQTISQLQAYEIAYTYEQNDGTEYVKQVAVLKTRTVYLITFTAPELLATQYLTEVDQSIGTFL
jgi:hypothetical protein